MKTKLFFEWVVIAILFSVPVNKIQAQAAPESATMIDFPKGIYATFADFKMGVPSDTQTEFIDKVGNDTISHRFFNAATEKRIRKEFAFSDGTDLFVNVTGMVKNFQKEDRGQMRDGDNYSLKAVEIGIKYIFFEDYFASQSAMVWGGAIAAGASRRLKGVVYDRDIQTFNLFKNGKEFADYIKANHPEYSSEVPMLDTPEEGGKVAKTPKKEEIEVVRRVVHKINQAAASVKL